MKMDEPQIPICKDVVQDEGIGWGQCGDTQTTTRKQIERAEEVRNLGTSLKANDAKQSAQLTTAETLLFPVLLMIVRRYSRLVYAHRQCMWNRRTMCVGEMAKRVSYLAGLTL